MDKCSNNCLYTNWFGNGVLVETTWSLSHCFNQANLPHPLSFSDLLSLFLQVKDDYRKEFFSIAADRRSLSSSLHHASLEHTWLKLPQSQFRCCNVQGLTFGWNWSHCSRLERWICWCIIFPNAADSLSCWYGSSSVSKSYRFCCRNWSIESDLQRGFSNGHHYFKSK